jgi:polyisoprenoid-binding protein YceI
VRHIAVFLALFLSLPAFAEPILFDRFDQNHSTLGFEVPILGGLSVVEGKFTQFSARVLYDPDDVASSWVEATIEVGSIDTGIAARDEHLRSADFFDAANHPQIRFASSRVERRGESWVAVGSLEIRGVKREVALPFEIRGLSNQPGSSEVVLGLSAATKLNRQDFGISWRHDDPSFVGDHIAVNLHLISKLTRREPPSPIQLLSWMVGCWEQKQGERVTTEYWLGPAGGAMVGGSRTVKGGRMVAFEFLRIAEHEGKLAYIATPSGQKETAFTLVEQSPDAVLFANPTHDFPQRIRYRRVSDDELLAQIEAGEGAAAKVIPFPYKRVPCEPLMRQP